MTTLNQSLPIAAVQRWVERVVVGMELCPFARATIEARSIVYKAVAGDIIELLQQLGEELARLDKSTEIQTSLLIVELGFENFDDYLDLVSMADQLLTELGYEGVFQLASFHPDYSFEGSQVDDVENYTNRSPYPVIQILRESGISAVLDSFRNPESIPDINMEKMRKLGVDKARAVLANCLKFESDRQANSKR